MKILGRYTVGAKYVFLTSLAAGLLIGPTAGAAPGYTYHLLWEGPNNQNSGLEEGYCPGVAINNRGDVVFRTSSIVNTSPYVARNRIYVSWGGQLPELVYETVTNNNDPAPSGLQCNEYPALLGINDNGIVAIPAKWVSVDPDGNTITYNDVGYVLVESGRGVIRELRGLQNSSGRLNSSLQMAGSMGRQLTITDGISSQSSPLPSDNHTIWQHAVINDSGTAVAAGTIFSLPGTLSTTLYRTTPPQPVNSVILGTYLSQDGTGQTGYTNFFTPGFNDLGWASFSTNFSGGGFNNPDPRVLLIGPTGNLFTVATTIGSAFENFWQTRGQSSLGTSLNNFNRVSFVAQLQGDFAQGLGNLYVGDASGDPPRLAIDNNIEFGDGRRFEPLGLGNDVADHGTNSLNDIGEIAVSALGSFFDANGGFIEQRQVLFIARPAPGLEPGNPIIPAPEDTLPGGGWRILPCWSVIQVAPFRCWVDPPIAVGYDYTMTTAGAFASVLIPVPLAGGDTDFVAEFNGVSAPLTAGAVLEFALHTLDPVTQFRIAGIDVTEELDPADPTAFVAGLTFTQGVTEELAFTMVPVVVDDSQDSTPPVIQAIVKGKLGNAGWYRGNVTVTWSVVDAESAINASTGCGASSVRTDTAGVTFTCSATSTGGAASSSVTIRRDTSAPTVSIVQPANGATYSQNQIVNASYSCSDAVSGVQSCVGSVANGQPILTAKKAKNAKFTVTATDSAGNVGRSTTTYSVN